MYIVDNNCTFTVGELRLIPQKVIKLICAMSNTKVTNLKLNTLKPKKKMKRKIATLLLLVHFIQQYIFNVRLLRR